MTDRQDRDGRDVAQDQDGRDPSGEADTPTTYTGGEATSLDDPDLPLSREDEGMASG